MITNQSYSLVLLRSGFGVHCFYIETVHSMFPHVHPCYYCYRHHHHHHLLQLCCHLVAVMLVCLCCFHPVSNFRSFSADLSFRRWRFQPHAQPLTWRTRVSLFLWVNTFDLSFTGGPTSSHPTAIIALRIIWRCKPHNYIKVNLLNLLVLLPCLTFNNLSVVLLVL